MVNSKILLHYTKNILNDIFKNKINVHDVAKTVQLDQLHQLDENCVLSLSKVCVMLYVLSLTMFIMMAFIAHVLHYNGHCMHYDNLIRRLM